MHPALHSWREELPSSFVRLLAYLGALLLLSMAAARIFQSAPVTGATTPMACSDWVEIERPFPAFALAIPEAADAPAGYAILRHTAGGGRKDIVSLGEPQGTAPYLQVEIYRPGREIAALAPAQDALGRQIAALEAVSALRMQAPLASKFGAFTVAAFDMAADMAAPSPRHCLGFLRDFDDAPDGAPLLQLSGRFCQGGPEFIERSTLACALDRLTLLSAGSEPKIGALFAQAELHRDFCGQRDPILSATPKYHLLWKALASRPEPRRIGR